MQIPDDGSGLVRVNGSRKKNKKKQNKPGLEENLEESSFAVKRTDAQHVWLTWEAVFRRSTGAPDSAAGRSQLAVISAEFTQCLIEHN